MKFHDVLSTALLMLRRQKTRTAISLVGVVIGSLMLLFSLASRRGIQDAVARVFSMNKEMRQIEVSSRWGVDEEDDRRARPRHERREASVYAEAAHVGDHDRAERVGLARAEPGRGHADTEEKPAEQAQERLRQGRRSLKRPMNQARVSICIMCWAILPKSMMFRRCCVKPGRAC